MTPVVADTIVDNTLYISLCDSIKEGAAIVRAGDHKFIYCNKSFLKLFAVNLISDMDISLFNKLRKDELTEEVIAQRENIIAEKGLFSELVEYVPLEGDPFFAEASIQYFCSNGRGYYFLTVIPVDKAFLELASLGILMVNKNGIIVTVNPFILKQFGYEKKEIIGKKIELLIPSRFHRKHIKHRDLFLNNPADRPVGIGMDLFAVKKDGSEFPVEVSLGHYPSDGDKYVIAFINDISVRKGAEAETKKLHEELESKVEQRTNDLKVTLRELELSRNELQKSNLFQKTLLDNAGAIIISIDESGIIQTFNPEAERKLGYQADEMIGKHTPLIFHDLLFLKKRAEELSKELQRNIPADINLFFVKARLNMPNEGEWMYVRKDGTKFPVRLNITAMKNERGVIEGLIGIAIDISKAKQVEVELNQSLKKEKDLGELKSRFVTMASHEFRTPLSTVLSSAYLIEKYSSAAEQSKRETHIQRIVASVNMLTDILNDFLSVGKIEEGKIQVRLTHFNIRELVTEIIDGIENSLKANQKILYHHEGNEEVILDASLLKHIVMNLASNASKFSREASMIEITSSCCVDHVKISVKDHGIGIAKADQQHLMERFFRGANAGNIQGTGLGLHIVAKYAELMNGIVECKSELEKGTEFIVTFNNKKC